MNYLITGGTGFIGKNFISNNIHNANKIIILTRKNINKIKDNEIYNNVTYINNLTEIANLEHIDCIINLAGSSIGCLWTKKNKEKLINSRISVTEEVLKLIARLTVKPKVMLSASAIGYYGDYDQEELTESSAAKSSFTHELCNKWEKTALQAKQYNVRVCIARFGVVLGSKGGFIKDISLPFKLGLGGKIGSGKQYFSWIHISDAIQAMQFLIKNNNCSGAYNFTSPNNITNIELTKSLGRVLNRPTVLKIPAIAIKISLREMGENLLLKGNKILPEKLLSAGYKFSYPNIYNALKNIYGK